MSRINIKYINSTFNIITKGKSLIGYTRVAVKYKVIKFKKMNFHKNNISFLWKVTYANYYICDIINIGNLVNSYIMQCKYLIICFY